jgi:hypothetical protein
VSKPIFPVFILCMMAFISPVKASEFGCKILLCLSNPISNGGPKGIAECVAPITQLFNDLRKGHPFPTCDLSDGNDGSNYAKLTNDPYDFCPINLTPAYPLSHVIQGHKKTASKMIYLTSKLDYELNGEERISQSELDPSRACVGASIGSYLVGNNEEGYLVNVYDKVVWQSAQSPRVIDVYINRSFFQRIHW